MKKAVVLLMIFAFVHAASAELIFSQPQGVYNIGDQLDVDLTLRPSTAYTEFVTVQLVCNGESVELYRNPLSLHSGETHVLHISTALSHAIVGSVEGVCTLEGSYGEDQSSSQSFTLTRELKIETTLDASQYSPSETLYLDGTVALQDGSAVDGFIEIMLASRNLSFSSLVSSGSFSANITLPDDLAPGSQTLNIRAYDRDSRGTISNEGTTTLSFTMKTVLTHVEVELSSTEVTPGENISFIVRAYDQAGNELERLTHYQLVSASQKVLNEGLVKTSLPNTLNFELNATPGYWKIQSTVDDLEAKRVFYVSEKELIDVSRTENTVTIKNIGNVAYHKSVEIDIGNFSAIKEVDLEVGQSKKFKLSAPDASYDISVRDGSRQFNLGAAPLTGRAIGIGDVRDLNFSLSWIALGVLVLLSAVFGVNVYMARKKTSRTSSFLSKGARVEKSAYLVGKQELATVIALNKESLSADGASAVERILKEAERSGGLVLHDDKIDIAAFPKSKAQEHDVRAVELAHRLNTILKPYSAKGKGQYGLAVHRGPLLVNYGMKGSPFTSVGSLVPSVKKLAQQSKNEVILSPELYREVMAKVKAEKTSSGWRLTGMVDRSSHNGFIDGFLKRQDKSE